MPQKNYTPHYEHLKNKWTEKHRGLQQRLWEKHKDSLEWFGKQTHHFAAGSLAGLLFLASPSGMTTRPTQPVQVLDQSIDKSAFLISDLQNNLPKDVRPLLPEEEDRIGGILTERYGFHVTAELEGKKLNRSYGLIGAEQHLMRYPGDTMATHFATAEEVEKYTSSGMAPGRGAWGYFANSQAEMTEQDVMREKYYIAVQTFLTPGYNENVREYSQFFKYRKMLVVNPQNGHAIVAVIGDAGPAEWTGKHLGGSPEVMKHLERVDGSQRGPVLYYFVDDPEDTIPLGPINVK